MGFPAAGQRRRPFGPTYSGLGCTTGNRQEFVLFCCASSRTRRRVRVRSGRRVTGSQQRTPAGPCGLRPQTRSCSPRGSLVARPDLHGPSQGVRELIRAALLLCCPAPGSSPCPAGSQHLFRSLKPSSCLESPLPPPLCSVFFTPLLGFPGFCEALISGASKPWAGGGGYFRNGREQRLLGLDSCNCHPFYGEKGFAPSPHLLPEHQYLPRIWAGVGVVGCWSS